MAGWGEMVDGRGPEWNEATRAAALTRRESAFEWVCVVRYRASGCLGGWGGVAATGISTMVLVMEYP